MTTGRTQRVTVGQIRRSFAGSDEDMPLLFADLNGGVRWRCRLEGPGTSGVLVVHLGSSPENPVLRNVRDFLGEISSLPPECEVRFHPPARVMAAYPVLLVEIGDSGERPETGS